MKILFGIAVVLLLLGGWYRVVLRTPPPLNEMTEVGRTRYRVGRRAGPLFLILGGALLVIWVIGVIIDALR